MENNTFGKGLFPSQVIKIADKLMEDSMFCKVFHKNKERRKIQNEDLERRFMAKKKYLEFEDTNVVAYLHYKGHPFVPYKKERDRIAFKVYGDNVEESLSEMYLDTEIQSFLKCLKTVRNSLFTTKAMLHEQESQED